MQSSLVMADMDPAPYMMPADAGDGFTVLSGDPQLRTSWPALDIALARATGGEVVGEVVTHEPGHVLFLALRDSERRLQARMARRMPAGWKGTDRLHIATRWPRSNGGGIAQVRAWAASVEQPRMVIIDTLMEFRALGSGKGSTYRRDHAAVTALASLSREMGLSIIVIHPGRSY